MKGYIKDPQATLDYEFDWAPWLGTDYITESNWDISPTGSANIVVGSETIPTNKTTRCFIEGGDVGDEYILTNTITTVGQRTDERSIKIRIQER